MLFEKPWPHYRIIKFWFKIIRASRLICEDAFDQLIEHHIPIGSRTSFGRNGGLPFAGRAAAARTRPP